MIKVKQSSYEVSKSYLQPMCEPCWVRSSAISKIEAKTYDNHKYT
jgi:hypothetical protein